MLFRLHSHLFWLFGPNQSSHASPISLILLDCVHTIFLDPNHGMFASSMHQLLSQLCRRRLQNGQPGSVLYFIFLIFCFQSINTGRHLRLSGVHLLQRVQRASGCSEPVCILYFRSVGWVDTNITYPCHTINSGSLQWFRSSYESSPQTTFFFYWTRVRFMSVHARLENSVHIIQTNWTLTTN